MLEKESKTFCVPWEHKLVFVSETHGEILWECIDCPYFKFQYQDGIGG